MDDKSMTITEDDLRCVVLSLSRIARVSAARSRVERSPSAGRIERSGSPNSTAIRPWMAMHGIVGDVARRRTTRE